MLVIGIILALLALLDVAAIFSGSDSRDGNDWVRHAPVGRR